MRPVRFALLLLLALLSACDGCGDHVAELVHTAGQVELERDKERGQFAAAEHGERLWLGDGLRTGADGRARLQLVPEGVALVEPNTLMRFLSEEPGKRHDRIALEEGTVSIDAAPLDLEVHTPRAIARLSRHGKLRVTASRGGEEQFDVLVGRVVIDHEGQSRELSVGESLAIPSTQPVPASAPEVTSLPTTPSPGAEAEDASVPRAPPQPGLAVDANADLDLPGESAVVHAPVLPLRVRIPLPPCDQALRVDISNRARPRPLSAPVGATHVVAALEAGSQRVRVRCASTVHADVRLRVQRDPATQELPKSAPQVAVEADGRNYTVHYQNVLPGVAFAWPRAQPASTYTLVLDRAGRAQRFPATGAALTLKPGDLVEGAYRFWFEAAGAAKSPESNLRIVFDNTARSAYLSEPRLGTLHEGPIITVAGAALSRSEVSVGEQRLGLDAQGRFRGDVPVAPGQESLAVRVRHPQAGLHYYLRRIR
jgi:hypothetical protein